MTKLHSATDAINQAIKGGYPLQGIRIRPDFEIYFCDPLFWKALGKARGWKDREYGMETITNGRTWVQQFASKKYAKRWFETRLSNGDENKFWQSLP